VCPVLPFDVILTGEGGIAYAISNKKASDIQVITQWGSNTMEKVPTRVAYSSENKNLSNDAYGYAVRPAQVSCSFFKLLLCKEFSSAEWDDEILRKVMAEGSSKLIHIPADKTAEDVATDYLRFLYDTLMRTLRNGMGVNALADTPIVFNLTVPATWSPAGRDITRQCALRAGFEDRDGDSVALCDEPECAALAAMSNNIRNFGDRATFEVSQKSIHTLDTNYR
jgi:molecular chaperone DnaK (HSP70)